MKIAIGIIAGLLIFTVAGISFYLFVWKPAHPDKGKTDGGIPPSPPSYPPAQPPCVPYTQKQKDAEMQECLDNCQGLPITPFGLCIQVCAKTIADRPIVNC